MAAAAAAADSADPVTTATCAHCHREVPSPNIALHSAHCARNLQKCEHCGYMVPKKLMDEHYDENHAPMICSLCQKTVQRELWDLHKGLQCPQRMLACQYCDFELPAADIYEHQNIVSLAGSMSDCGNRLDMTSSSILNPLLLQNLQVTEARWKKKRVIQQKNNQYDPSTLMAYNASNFLSQL
uniref:TRAF-type domain-containing protein n=1 Tax=Oryza meridionalis TaxID=40149 RepID=A0A0E0EFJ0_9ORYZ